MHRYTRQSTAKVPRQLERVLEVLLHAQKNASASRVWWSDGNVGHARSAVTQPAYFEKNLIRRVPVFSAVFPSVRAGIAKKCRISTTCTRLDVPWLDDVFNQQTGATNCAQRNLRLVGTTLMFRPLDPPVVANFQPTRIRSAFRRFLQRVRTLHRSGQS